MPECVGIHISAVSYCVCFNYFRIKRFSSRITFVKDSVTELHERVAVELSRRV